MKRLIVAVAVLLSLGAASAETVRSELTANKTDSAAATMDVSSVATVQLASSWLGHAKASTDARLARPL
jgi:hypothetical protein